jgi:hypothetical protein
MTNLLYPDLCFGDRGEVGCHFGSGRKREDRYNGMEVVG